LTLERREHYYYETDIRSNTGDCDSGWNVSDEFGRSRPGASDTTRSYGRGELRTSERTQREVTVEDHVNLGNVEVVTYRIYSTGFKSLMSTTQLRP
jgi:hypothetical protein